MPNRRAIAGMMDLSAVQAQNTEDDVRALVALAKEYRCIAVFTLPGLTGLAAHLLGDEPGIRLGGVVGFPSGGSTTALKAGKAEEMVGLGCFELDMVINVGLLRSGRLEAVRTDIRGVVRAAQGAPVKVILECHHLTDEEIRTACRICLDSGAAYVKTGTGWTETGATPHNVALMKSVVRDRLGVKAAGGIRNLKTLLELHGLGATRFGVGYDSAQRILRELSD